MTVVQGFVGDRFLKTLEDIPQFSRIVPPSVIDTLVDGISLNSTAYEGKDDKGIVV